MLTASLAILRLAFLFWAPSYLPLAHVQIPNLETESLEKEPRRHSYGVKLCAFQKKPLPVLKILLGTTAIPSACLS